MRQTWRKTLIVKIVYIGTSSFACPALEILARHPSHEIVAVFTQPDRPAGRRLELTPSPVKELSMRLHLPVFQPESIKSPTVLEQVRYMHPDLIVVAAYGQLLPQALLDIPKFGCMNIHGSLLPKYRGAAPVHWALLDGESKTGVTIMMVSDKLDSGGILAQEEITIRRRDNSQIIHDKLADIGARLLVRTISDFLAGKVAPKPQGASSTAYARKLTKADMLLDWGRTPLELWLKIRAFAPSPGAYTFVTEGGSKKILKIYDVIMSREKSHSPGQIARIDKHGVLVGAKNGALLLREVQLEGRRRMSARDLANSGIFKIGDPLG